MNCQWELAKMTAERDAAQQMVAEMRATFSRLLKNHHVGHGAFPRTQCSVCIPIDFALSATIADRWCLASERDAAQRVVAEFRGALADIADSEDEHGVPSTREWMQRRASDALVSHGNNQFCLRVDLDAVIARLDSFESNVVAQKERLKLATETIEKLFAAAMAGPTGDSVADAEDAKNAWDAVQGDDKGQP